VSSNKRLLIIIGVIVAIIIGLLALVLEIRSVPDYDWYEQYEYDSKEPYSLWLFTELMKTSYGEDNITINEADSLYLGDGKNQLYVVVGDNVNYTTDQNEKLIEYIENGNDALIITQHTGLRIPLDSFYAQKLHLIDTIAYDHVVLDSEGDTTYTDGEYKYDEKDYNDEDSIYVQDGSYNNYNDSYYEDPSDSLLFISRYLHSFYDTIMHIATEPFDSTYSDHIYSNYHKELKRLVKRSYTHLTELPIMRKESISYEELMYTTEARAFFVKMKLGEGELYIHTMPHLLTNIGSRQEYYLDHANEVLSHFNPTHIIVDKPRINFEFDRDDDIRKSPIAFILKTPSLAWAYYTLFASLLLFVIFRSKRLQRIIPLIEKNENTSIQYIKTLSTLYQSHEQNNKLVIHMRDVFYNKIKNKYFLDHTLSNYVEQLSRKTKISEKEISTLLHKFESAKNSNFTDDQLIVLHNQIESFHKKSK